MPRNVKGRVSGVIVSDGVHMTTVDGEVVAAEVPDPQSPKGRRRLTKAELQRLQTELLRLPTDEEQG